MTAPPLALRPYQADIVSGVTRRWSQGHRRVAVVSPTGTGKTVTFSALVRAEREARGRVAVLVHRDELLRQTAGTLAALTGERPGIVQAHRDDVARDLVVCSVQSLSPRRLRDLGRRDLVVADEAHHASAPTWRRAIETMTRGAGRVAGFTATLHRGDDAATADDWDSVLTGMTIREAILDGWLVPVTGLRVPLDALTPVLADKRGHDYVEARVGEVMQQPAAAAAVADAIVQHAEGRSTVLFAPTVDAARADMVALHGAGLTAELITGDTSTTERQATFRRHRNGTTQVLVNVMVLTEGWDAPYCEVAVITRPTRNPALFQQMVGRVLRPSPGKRDALVIDVTGADDSRDLSVTLDQLTSARPDSDVERAPGWRSEDADEPATGARHAVPVGTLSGFALEEFELFSASSHRWLKDDRGIRFLPTSGPFILVSETDDGLYRSARTVHRATGKGTWLGLPAPLSIAMAVAEAEAARVDAEAGLVVSGKGATWRGRATPTEGQVAAAARFGLDVSGMRRGDASDVITREMFVRRTPTMTR